MNLFRLSAALCSLTVLTSALAAPPGKATSEAIPDKPTAPPSLTVHTPSDRFQCQREFIYQGERISCDSMIRQDGERLRPIIQGVPEAIAELDIYQRNRRGIRTSAYIGTLGILIFIGGSFYSRSFKNLDGSLSDKGKLISDLALFGGLGLTGLTVIYGISTLQNNEAHLGNAVRLYNEKNPDRPIELQFSTEFNL